MSATLSTPARAAVAARRVVTVTMNPALDTSFTVPRLTPTHKMRGSTPTTHPGGGGVNVARVLHTLGEDVVALFPVGGHVGAALLDQLGAEGVPSAAVPVAGETRESHHVTDLDTGLEYRFVLPGPTLGAEDQRRCLVALDEHAEGAAYVVLSGSFPPGVAADFVGRVAQVAGRHGAQLVVDTSGPALAATRGAYLLKPSVRELGALLGRPLESLVDQVHGARDFLARVDATALLLSRGNQGVVLVTAHTFDPIPAFELSTVSTVGAGDALLAGTLAGLCRRWSLSRAARFGVACSAAMVRTPGTAVFSPADLAGLTAETVLAPPRLRRVAG